MGGHLPTKGEEMNPNKDVVHDHKREGILARRVSRLLYRNIDECPNVVFRNRLKAIVHDAKVMTGARQPRKE